MKLDKLQLIELSDYIDALWDTTQFDIDAYDDVKKAISRELDKLQKEDNLTTHFDQMGHLR